MLPVYPHPGDQQRSAVLSKLRLQLLMPSSLNTHMPLYQLDEFGRPEWNLKG